MRQPIHIEVRGLQTPRERIWAAILYTAALNKPLRHFDRAVVQDHCNPMVSFTAVKDYFVDLEAAGYITQVASRPPKPGKLGTTHVYTLAKAPGTAPRVGAAGQLATHTGVDAMWQAMKVLQSFDHHGIARAATLAECIVKPGTAKAYVNALARAGYLTVLRPAKSGTAATYRLGNNTGPHAPAITRLKTVFDRNTGEFAHLQTAQEVCDAIA